MAYRNLIEGNTFSDERGTLNFINAFDMSEIVRFYEITPANTDVIRAWQGHQKEKKWFYCNSGSFVINLVKVNDFKKPSSTIVPERFEILADSTAVLEISGGYATGFKATEDNSKLMVFSNFNLEQSKEDDFRFPLDTWKAKW
jgi:dTDP-4-dehydrorhamnose 3,5-epimerase-like enzyme